MSEATAGTLETKKDLGENTPRNLVRRWLLELKLANKGEEKWRTVASKIYKRYRGEDRRKNSFNILWTNTEILRPAIYNSTPKPDARRRYRDADPIGKAVSETLSRSLEFTTQTYDIDSPLKLDVLDYLLGGRGLSRVRYIPSLAQVGDTQATGKESAETDKAHESQEGTSEELTWEQVSCEHVNWADFRRGQGRIWPEVQWVGFRHKLTRHDHIDQFGEAIGSKVQLQDADDSELKKLDGSDPVKSLFATGEVWEIWDKDERKVYFISAGYLDAPLKVQDDPLGLEQFFPIPKPLLVLEDTDTLVPTPVFVLYEEQANELDLVTRRINKLVDACKMRGIYDSTIGELAQIFRGDDNDLIPAKNVAAFLDRGGIQNMVWWMPVEQVAKVLAGLYQQREQVIGTIYQLTGISDIARGETNPGETATAQALKSQWGTMRLQKMQREVQRYCRDLIRMMSEVIANKFQQETLQAMTLLPYATAEQVAQMQAQQAQAAQMAAAQGQPPPPQPPPPITWEQVMQVLRSKALRAYHIDIETDSTVADQLQGDMQGLAEVLQAVNGVMTSSAPLVMSGALPIEAVKELVQTICRRARMGNAVEEAFEKIQAPQTPPDQKGDNGAAAQATVQVAQINNQTKQQELQIKGQQHQTDIQADLQKKQMELQSQERIKAAELQAKQRTEMLGQQLQPQIDPAAIEQMIAKALQPILQHMQQGGGTRRIEIVHSDPTGGLIQ